MKVYIYSLLLLICCSCSSYNHKKEYRKYAQSEYKLYYFESCLKYGFYSNSHLIQLMTQDKSSSGEPILGYEYAFIDSIAKRSANQMVLDSIQRNRNPVPEGADGKRVIRTCLEHYGSSWLDSLARKRTK